MRGVLGVVNPNLELRRKGKTTSWAYYLTASNSKLMGDIPVDLFLIANETDCSDQLVRLQNLNVHQENDK
ncbi:unnamed protein product [Schistosoma curassoni]|uniref:Guanylate cyclase domain-containing protein n=1 Tax=Schistosoma curassoni TaxID=6186 RepID=A0A183KSP8_9TREM|nr:unnamed protein product [Schistosoma curassoni]